MRVWASASEVGGVVRKMSLGLVLSHQLAASEQWPVLQCSSFVMLVKWCQC